jgi:hypothetical protein
MAASANRNRRKTRTASAHRRIPVYILICCSLLYLTLSCTGEPPEILRTFWQLNLVEDLEQDLTYQSLSLFVKPTDPDGFEDIEDMYLINDEQELFWRLDRESWAQSGTEEDVWIGSNSLKMPDGASFPTGEYRILLRDVGGDSAEQGFRLRSVTSSRARDYLPEVTIGDDGIRVAGAAAVYQLWVYDSNGRYVTTLPISGTPLPLASVTKAQPALREAFTFKVHGTVEELNLGVSTGPYYVSP